MRILTVRQPWAGAILHRGKNVENRTRNLAGDYRGPVAIHVGLRHDYTAVDAHNQIAGHLDEHSTYGYGHIIGVVDLAGVHPSRVGSRGPVCLAGSTVPMHEKCSPWGEVNAHHLVLENPRPLVVPIPYRGSLGLRTLPDELIVQVLAGVV